MRLPTENKRHTATCPHCSRPVGNAVEHCRQVNLGWYCWQRGLIFDVSAAIRPTPDPVSDAEQQVIDSYTDRIAAAQQVVDNALASFTAAQIAHRQGLLEAREIGVQSRYTALWFARGKFRDATTAERNAMERRLEQLFKAEEAAGERLSEARRALGFLEAWCDHERRVARQ